MGLLGRADAGAVAPQVLADHVRDFLLRLDLNALHPRDHRVDLVIDRLSQDGAAGVQALPIGVGQDSRHPKVPLPRRNFLLPHLKQRLHRRLQALHDEQDVEGLADPHNGGA